MSASNTFVEKFSAEYAQSRNILANRLTQAQARALDEYESSVRLVDAAQERYISAVEPLIAALSELPEGIVIENIVVQSGQLPNIVLSAGPGASLASLVMEYPALPFAMTASGALVEPKNTEGEALYSGLMVSNSSLEWQAEIGGQLVDVSCKNEGFSVELWNNPAETGAPVATMGVGDFKSTTPWHSFGRGGVNYWVQPSNAVAIASLDPAVSWRQNKDLLATLRDDFNQRISAFPGLFSAQGKIVVNALFSWATSSQELPAKEDFTAWTAPRGNVLAMHSPQDWAKLTGPADKVEAVVKTPAQERIHMLSERLPNIRRFADDAAIGVLCEAMAETQTRLQASPSLAV